MNIPKEYELRKTEEVPDLDIHSTFLMHKKSGARILVLECDDDNKVFSIAFRTPVSDSTGAAHIIEHSVLCGSKRYPVKDPFMAMSKSSPNTFLNAFTYPDKTMYPVASCNEKDLCNLMSVYMDAVFYPNIYREKEIFMQEGWHYELSSPDAPLTVNGVVYNEMRGAFSDPNDIMSGACLRSLYPDTCYGNKAGGDPDRIPELSYEDFLAFHTRYYHPSNSYIILYGDLNAEERLRWLDCEYLCRFDRIDPSSAITRQTPFDCMREEVVEYPVADGEGVGRTWLSRQWSVGDILDRDVYWAMQILEYALVSAEGAILRRALLDAGICEDVTGGYSTDILQPAFYVCAKNTDPDKKAEFLRVVQKTLEDAAAGGLDPLSLEAAINGLEFKIRECDFGGYPKGLVFAMGVMESWLYDDDKPTLLISPGDIFDRMRSRIGTGYFEGIIRKYFIDNTHSSLIEVRPVAGLEARRSEELAARLADKKALLDDAQIAALVEECAALRAYQEEEPSQETLACLPHLDVADLDPEPRRLSTTVIRDGDPLILHHEISTRGITYVDLLFDFSTLDREGLLLATLLREVIGLLDTDKRSFADLSTQINLNLGGLDLAILCQETYDGSSFTPYLEVSFRFLHGKLDEALTLIREILFETQFTDSARLAALISQCAVRNEARIQGAPHAIAAIRSGSYGSVTQGYMDHVIGVEYLRFIDSIAKDPEASARRLLPGLKDLAAGVFRDCPLIVSVTDDMQGMTDLLKRFDEVFAPVRSFLPVRRPAAVPAFLPEAVKKNEGLVTTSQVNYDSLTGTWKGAVDFSGTFFVLRVLLAGEYLWNALRVRGGAYAVMVSFTRTGNVSFTSYRDPNVAETYDIYRTVPDYVASFDCDRRKLDDMIISIIGGIDAPVSPALWGSVSLSTYLSGLTYDMQKKERAQILGCTAADIRALAPAVQAVVDGWQICTLGSSAKVSEAAGIFNSVENLL